MSGGLGSGLLRKLTESRWRLLFGHFVRRFFDNDLTSAAGDFRVTAIETLAILATPGLIVSFWTLLVKYSRLSRAAEAVRVREVVSDEFFFISFSMIIMGFAAVLAWDRLFPDRLDQTVLSVLPVGRSTVYSAKIASLFAFLGMVTVAVNAFTAIFFPILGADPTGGLLMTSRLAAVHVVTLVLANAFIFLLFVTLRGLLIGLFPRRFAALSRGLQLALLSFLILLLVAMPVLFPSVDQALQDRGLMILYGPPLWFLGLFESLLGHNGETADLLARYALFGLAALAASALATYYLAYRRESSGAGEGSDSSQPDARRSGDGRTATGLLFPDPQERAVAGFLGATLLRSQRHLLVLIGSLGVSLGLIFAGLLQLSLHHWENPTATLCSIPLILSFAVVAGFRISFAVPAQLSANWVFRLCERDSNHRMLRAAWKLMIFGGALPVVLLTPLYLSFWSLHQTVVQLGLVILLSAALTELLLFRFRKLPFTCAYIPESSNLKLYWVGYVFLFSVYAYTLAEFEVWLQQKPGWLASILGAAAISILAWFRRRQREHEAGIPLVWESRPAASVQPLVLKR
jgi:hypothetical protein